MAKKDSPKKKSAGKAPKMGAKTTKAVKKAARKTAKKVAKKTASKVARKVAKKTTKKTVRAMTKAPEDSTGASTPPAVDLATAAYLIYLDRIKKGIPGDELSDWAAAERLSHAA